MYKYILITSVLLLVSCGGGGSSDPVSNTPTNSSSPSVNYTNEVETNTGEIFGLSIKIGEPITPDYNRPNTWHDTDNDCINDRHENLIAQHSAEFAQYPLTMSSDGCYVDTGYWQDVYDGRIYFESSSIQIDHVVALYEAWHSGLGNMSAQAKILFANTGCITAGCLPEQSHNFLAVGAMTNQDKYSYQPTEWMPPEETYHCTYLKKWTLVKHQNDLFMDQAEYDFIAEYAAQNCDASPLPDLPANE